MRQPSVRFRHSVPGNGRLSAILSIGYTLAYAYQLVGQRVPNSIHSMSRMADGPARQPMHLISFSFITLTSVGYGDAYPAHPAPQSHAMTEALIGQLYIAIMIAALVGMDLQARSDGAHSKEYSRQ